MNITSLPTIVVCGLESDYAQPNVRLDIEPNLVDTQYTLNIFSKTQQMTKSC